MVLYLFPAKFSQLVQQGVVREFDFTWDVALPSEWNKVSKGMGIGGVCKGCIMLTIKLNLGKEGGQRYWARVGWWP